MSATLTPLPKQTRTHLNPRAMAQVRAYIASHLCDPITLEDLATSACISRYHFARLFRATTGSSPMQYVRQARITAAMERLAQTPEPISGLAQSLGFFDQSHFTRTFRRATGLPPGRFTQLCAALGSPAAILAEPSQC